MIRARFSIYVGDSPQAHAPGRVAELLRSSSEFFDVLDGIDYVHASVDFPDHESVNERLRAIGIEQEFDSSTGFPKVLVYLQEKHEKEDAHYRN